MLFDESILFIIVCIRIGDQVIVSEAATPMILTETNVT